MRLPQTTFSLSFHRHTHTRAHCTHWFVVRRWFRTLNAFFSRLKLNLQVYAKKGSCFFVQKFSGENVGVKFIHWKSDEIVNTSKCSQIHDKIHVNCGLERRLFNQIISTWIGERWKKLWPLSQTLQMQRTGIFRWSSFVILQQQVKSSRFQSDNH